ncbi:MAG: malectin domain-containing carbohydrate-binding protein [Acidobacteriota bacterium]
MRAANGVSADQVRAEINSILAAPAFTRSPRLGRLLTYLCTKALAGESAQIKEYAIGVDVMDRPATFDPAEDAIARVEVHRLRKRLREYYEKEGAADRVQIVIPNGQYVPVFLPGAPERGKAAPPRGAVPGPRRLWPWLLGVAALALVVTAAFLLKDRAPASGGAPALTPAPVAGSTAIRLACGQAQPRRDRLGQQWLQDQFFEGGTAIEQQPKRFIARAFDQRLFDFARTGDFSYHIPLARGNYEMRLYFVETVYGEGAPGGGGEISRICDIFVNGRPAITAFDIVSDAGEPFVADVRAIKNLSPAADGKLHVRFVSRREQARLSAIEIVPAPPGLHNPVRLYFDDAQFTDSAGHTWLPASYVSGGQISRHAQTVSGAKDPELYNVERFGHFSFAIPVDAGTYALTLHFVEEYLGPGNPAAGGIGERRFDVICNGSALLRNFDIYREVGANRVLTKTFHGLKPNGLGKLQIDFVPIHNYPSLYALEVVDESR